MGKTARLKLGLRAKILLIVATVVLVAMVTNTLASSYLFTRQQTESHLLWAQAISRILGGQLERILFLGIPIDDLQGFERQCAEAVERNGDISYAFVVSATGNMLFHNLQAEGQPKPPVPPAVAEGIKQGMVTIHNPDDKSYAVIQPVMDPRGTKVADVIVGFPKEVIEEARSQLLWVTTGIDLGVFIISFGILFIALSRFVILPLSRIVRSLEDIQPGNIGNTRKLPEGGEDEVAIMSRAFNRLLERLAQHEQALVKAKEMAENANRSKSEFLAVMSHEIRTPMHAVLGMNELLLRSPLNETQASHASSIRRSGRALLSVINDILDFSKIEAEKLTLEGVDFDLLSVVEDAVDTLRGNAIQKQLQLTCEQPGLSVPLHGDPVRLMQVLLNLLSNAIKFTHRGEVCMRLMAEGPPPSHLPIGSQYLLIEVRDSGIGIQKTALERIFQPFSQADSSITRQYGGSGLGLAIVLRIIKLMHGELSVDSEPGVGSSFFLRVPFAAAEKELGITGTAPEIGSSFSPHIRVLLAEDDPVNQQVAKAMLENSGCRLTLAADGEQAVSLAQSRAFDLIFMDCHMPVLDGFSATQRIRDQPGPSARTPIIALTADVLQETRERCRDVGMDDYLAKPFSLSDLNTMVSRWLNSGTSADQEMTEMDLSEKHSRENAIKPFDPAPLNQIARLKRARERQLIRCTVELYLSEAGCLVETILESAHNRDWSSLRLATHRLKSSSANVGLMAVSESAAELESILRTTRDDAMVFNITRELKQLSAAGREALQHYVDTQENSPPA
ncbi:ATP-binding protein [Ectothiorhodospira shaposhnikovii]|uniref:ATP-binding protein n=1 Tax=Ectothiorhodospira shaposhnikovii TaxID=1054 RepID=UPI00190843A7